MSTSPHIPESIMARPALLLLSVVAVLHVAAAAEKSSKRQVDFTKYLKSAPNESSKSTAKRETFEAALRLEGADDIEGKKYPWVVAIMQGTSFFGIGGVVNMYWAATHTDTVSSNPAVDSLSLYEALDDTATVGVSIEHKNKAIVKHPDAANSKNVIAIIKVCPPFKTGAKLPNKNVVYGLGTPVSFVNYETHLREAKKKIGELCECDEVLEFDPTLDLCLAEDEKNWNKHATGSLVVVSGKFAGINIVSSDITGESYLDMGKYITWIRTNAVIL